MLLQKIYDQVLSGDIDSIKDSVSAAIDEGIEVNEIVSGTLIRAMDEVGLQMKNGELFVPEVLIAAEAMKEGLSVVKPLMQEDSSYYIGKVVIGTVAGDLHDIGKNLVAMMLESCGFEIIDLGVDVCIEDFLKAVHENKPDIVGLSALLTTTLEAMKDTVKAIKAQGNVKVIVGGAPVTEEYAQEINADGYGSDASEAVELAKNMLA